MNSLQELHDKHIAIVKTMYAKAAPDFDATPTVIIATDDALVATALYADSPFDAALAAVKAVTPGPDMVSFMSPAWRKDLAGNRIGEVVLLVSESKDERLGTILTVTRDPLTIVEDKSTDGAEIHSRINLLYHPAKQTEH